MARMRTDGDRCTVLGLPAEVEDRIRGLGDGWALEALDLGHRVWSDLEKHAARAPAEPAVTRIPALTGVPIRLDQDIGGDGRRIRAHLVRVVYDPRVAAEAIAELFRGARG